jgi:hypothetical protein
MKENRHVLRLLLLAVLFLAPVLACGPRDEAVVEGPTVTIMSPDSGATFTVGEQVLIQSSVSDEKGVSRVELVVNAAVVRVDPPMEGTPTTFAIAQPWFPEAAGEFVIHVIAYNTQNQASLPASITLQVVEGSARATPTPVPPTLTPVPDVTGESGCTLNAAYVADVSIPDNSEIQPGVGFVKIWRMRNTGTCDWGSGFQLVFVGGDQLGATPGVAVPATASGSTVDVAVQMTAPTGPGTYKSHWRMQSDKGQAFGSTVYVLIVVPEPATATPTTEPTSTGTSTSTPTDTPTPTEPPPDAPTDLTMTTSTGGFVSLLWVDNAADENGYHVLADGEIMHTQGADTTGWGFMYSDYADVWCDQTVDITVVAYRGGQWSDPSNAVQYTGPPCAPPVVAQGSGLTMALGECIDLDSRVVEPLSPGSEMLWQKPGGTLVLLAVNGTTWANVGLGGSVPSYVGCSSTPRTATGGVSVPTLQAGTRLCLDTTDGNLAGLYVDEIQPDDHLVISFVTWEGTP